MLKAMRLYGAFATLNVRFSNDKLLSMGMPKPALRITSPAACRPPGADHSGANGGRF
jgi:hypothetical protein